MPKKERTIQSPPQPRPQTRDTLWAPNKGEVYSCRDEVERKLLNSGWSFEGLGTSYDGPKVVGYNVGVVAGDKWLLVDMVPCEQGVCITKIKWATIYPE